MKNLLVLILCFYSWPLQAADPAWIFSGMLDEYRGKQYLTALGDGTSLEDARKSAYSRLAEQIKVSISSESDIVKEYRSTQGSSSQQENVNIRISTSVNLDNLKGIKIAEQYFQSSTGTHYAFAVLNKVKTATNLLFGIEEKLAQVKVQHQQAIDALGRGQAAEGIRKLLKTTHGFSDINADLELHRLFADPSTAELIRSSVLESIEEIDRSLQNILGRVQVLAYGAEKSGSPELGVDEPYQLAFSYQGQPLAKTPVSIIPDIEGFNIEAQSTTDRKGELFVKIRSFPYSGREFNRIKVQLDVYDELFGTRAPSADLVVLLTQKSNVAIRLQTSISGAGGQLDGIVADGMANMLSDENYNVLTTQDAADYELQVRGSVIKSPGINGLYFTRIDGVVNLKSIKSGRVLKTLKIDREATKAGGLSADMAAEKSAHKLAKSIRDDLLQTLEANLGRE